MIDLEQSVIEWLNEFSSCVRNLDYTRAKSMYSENALYFGSYNHILNNLDELVEKQWKRIWPNISDFQFNFDKLRIENSRNGEFVLVMVPWSSTGYNKDGSSFERPGRLSLLLILEDLSKRYVAHHTHYSLHPGTPVETIRAGYIID